MVSQGSSKRVKREHHRSRFDIRGRGYFHRLGPGIVTGAADDDPSGIGTYSQAGAQAGFGLLWTAPWLLPLAFATQEACARLALVTGKGLAAIIRERMPRWVLVIAVLLVAIANTVNIAADLASMTADLSPSFWPFRSRLGWGLPGALLGRVEVGREGAMVPIYREHIAPMTLWRTSIK